MVQKGNSCLLCLQRLSLILLCFVSLGFLGIGLFLLNETKNCGVFELLFIGLGSAEILASIYAICRSRSKGAMLCFVYTMGALIAFQAISSVLGVMYKDDIIAWAGENYSTDSELAKKFEELIKNNVTIALYLAIGASSLQVRCCKSSNV